MECKLKRKPETRPNKEILKNFLAWSIILKKPVSKCLESAISLYLCEDLSAYPVHLIENKPWHTFSFEYGLGGWEEFKAFALKKYGHSRDTALSIAMDLFNGHHDQKLREVL